MTASPKSVQAARGFLADLEDIAEQFLKTSPATAASRFSELRQALIKIIESLKQFPLMGRRAGFLSAKSEQGIAQMKRALRLAKVLNTADFREVLVLSYVVLYAPTDSTTLLLAIKDQRAASYRNLRPSRAAPP